MVAVAHPVHHRYFSYFRVLPTDHSWPAVRKRTHVRLTAHYVHRFSIYAYSAVCIHAAQHCDR